MNNKEEICDEDIKKIEKLFVMHKNLVKTLKEENAYIKELFDYFQQPKYYKTNFFINKTFENSFYSFLDEYDIEFEKKSNPFYVMLGELDYFQMRLYDIKIKHENEKVIHKESLKEYASPLRFSKEI